VLHRARDLIQPFCVHGAGVALASLDPGTILDVTTRNSCYRVTVLDNEGRAVIVGGTWFQEPTEVRLEGSTAGGRALRIGWISAGLRLEMTIGPRTITTSAIRSVRVVTESFVHRRREQAELKHHDQQHKNQHAAHDACPLARG